MTSLQKAEAYFPGMSIFLYLNLHEVSGDASWQ